MAYDLILRGGHVVDPTNGIDGPRDIAIEDGRIAAVSDQLADADSDRVIDASRRIVIPGIIDTHVHVGGFGGRTRALGHRMTAETGVTTCLDMGSTMDTIIEGMRDTGAGMNVAALLTTAAAFEDHDPSEAEIADRLEQELERGAFGLKIIGGHWPLTPDASARAIEVANRRGVYVAFHLGTTESSSNLLGLRELPSLMGENGRVHVAHVAAYTRGMIETPLEEVNEAIAILERLGDRAVSESYLSTKVDTGNATAGQCDGDDVSDHVTRNCLLMGGYEPTRSEMRRAIRDGYCAVFVERGGRIVLAHGEEAERAWTEAGTNIGVSFPVTPPESALALMTARHANGSFAVDALATDGGGIPRNWMVERGLALVRIGAMTLEDYVRKASATPAAMMGLLTKGQIGVGADADITVLDLERGVATMSLVAGQPIMIDGESVASGGTLLVTEAGEGHARTSRLGVEVVDPRQARMYASYSRA